MARPIPLEEPVTTAVAPFSSPAALARSFGKDSAIYNGPVSDLGDDGANGSS